MMITLPLSSDLLKKVDSELSNEYLKGKKYTISEKGVHSAYCVLSSTDAATNNHNFLIDAIFIIYKYSFHSCSSYSFNSYF